MGSFQVKRAILWVPALAVLGVLLWLVLRPQVIEAEVVRVVRTEFREVLRSEGVLRSRRRYSVTAFADGDMRRMDLKVGDRIKKGAEITSILWDLRPEPLRSPITGVVSKVFRENAGPVRRGEAILEVVDPRDLEAVIELLTPEAARVRAGMPVQLGSLLLGREFRGEVAEVSRAGFVKISALGVEEERTEVRIRLLEAVPIEAGGDEFHLEASITISTTPGALVIPVGAMFRDDGHWAVYRYDRGTARKTRFDPKIRSEGWQVVGAGLSEGDEILNFPSDRVREGARIRPLQAKAARPPR